MSYGRRWLLVKRSWVYLCFCAAIRTVNEDVCIVIMLRAGVCVSQPVGFVTFSSRVDAEAAMDDLQVGPSALCPLARWQLNQYITRYNSLSFSSLQKTSVYSYRWRAVTSTVKITVYHLFILIFLFSDKPLLLQVSFVSLIISARLKPASQSVNKIKRLKLLQLCYGTDSANEIVGYSKWRSYISVFLAFFAIFKLLYQYHHHHHHHHHLFISGNSAHVTT